LKTIDDILGESYKSIKNLMNNRIDLSAGDKVIHHDRMSHSYRQKNGKVNLGEYGHKLASIRFLMEKIKIKHCEL